MTIAVEERTDTARQEIQLNSIDTEGFCRELEELRADVGARLDNSDYQHLLKIQMFGRVLTLVGLATAWIAPNPISIICLSLGVFTRWLLMHHVGHGGYDNVPGVAAKHTSAVFAQGWRRAIDWLDWIHPNGWNYEHNILHHYNTGEYKDPDLVERHLEFMRNMKLPYWLKRLFIYVAGVTWKYTYYAPNTMSCLDPDTLERQKFDHIAWVTILNVLDLRRKTVRRLWTHCYFPYGTVNFVILPLLFLPLGWRAVAFVFINRFLAELLTNFHAYLVVAPSHSAGDVCRFGFHFKGKAQYYLTQVMGSSNYRTGTETIDYMHAYLNYQIEHHLFPDLPMCRYREIQPRVKEICETYGVPYIQEGVWTRFERMVLICIGKESMIDVENPDELDAAAVRMQQG